MTFHVASAAPTLKMEMHIRRGIPALSADLVSNSVGNVQIRVSPLPSTAGVPVFVLLQALSSRRTFITVVFLPFI